MELCITYTVNLYEVKSLKFLNFYQYKVLGKSSAKPFVSRVITNDQRAFYYGCSRRLVKQT